MEVLKRIIGSKKVLLAVIASVFTIFGTEVMKLQPLVIQSVDALFLVLIIVQGALDYKHGSPSDNTTT